MAGVGAGLKIVLFLGSTREGRMGLRVAKFMQKHLAARKYEVEFFDPVAMNFPMLEKPIHFYKDKSAVPQWLQVANDKIAHADAYVVVSAEYNHSIPPALSNVLDHFPGSIFSYKPSAIVTYSPGPFGGVRAAMQLRALLAEIGCLSVSNVFSVPDVGNAISDEGQPMNERMDRGANRLLDQLDWMTWAMKNHRDKVGRPS